MENDIMKKNSVFNDYMAPARLNRSAAWEHFMLVFVKIVWVFFKLVTLFCLLFALLMTMKYYVESNGGIWADANSSTVRDFFSNAFLDKVNPVKSFFFKSNF